MEVTQKLSKQVTETKYLAVDNTKRYRPIIRYLYNEYEKINYMLYKEDVFIALSGKLNFEDYTIEQCEQDLHSLVEWGNLIALQDTSQAMTIDEFKNKRYRYQLSDYSVEIERLVIKLENLYIEGASLEPSLIERIKDEILKVDKVIKNEIDVTGWWKALNNDFKLLNDNYKDYIRDFYTTRLEEFVKTDTFVRQKDALVRYLRNFISGLQKNTYIIEDKLKSLNENDNNMLLNNILESQKQVVRLDEKSQNITDEEYMTINYEKWENLKSWFIGKPKKTESELQKIYKITNDIIQKITRYASQIIESKGNMSTRKEVYQKIAELFCNCKDIEEANTLSARVFGIFTPKYIKGNIERQSDSININISQEQPVSINIKPRSRIYKEKLVKMPIEDKSIQKERLKLEYEDKIEEERRLILACIKNGRIDLETLPKVDKIVRSTILKWIDKAYSSPDMIVKTENGQRIKIVIPEDQKMCRVEFSDGYLTMPAYVIEFLD